MLEINPDIDLTANDINKDRIGTIDDNLKRLKLTCTVTNEDLLDIKNLSFNKILLDAPCSATGIIRRHPDIKMLRRDTDIDKLCVTQASLLSAAWELLEQGGELLYSTCSVLPRENEEVINQFVSHRQDVEVIPIELESGINLTHGCQLLPTINGHDGFYYSLLRKLSQRQT